MVRVPGKNESTSTTTRSPWDEAKERGIGFRGVGNEPGWFVEVGTGETPHLHAELDYGERMLDVAQLQSLSGLLGYAGTSQDGAAVRLVIERKPCSDGMSDETYPATAQLDVGDKSYRGCGRFLAD
jgi:putative lipoprotein